MLTVLKSLYLSFHGLLLLEAARSSRIGSKFMILSIFNDFLNFSVFVVFSSTCILISSLRGLVPFLVFETLKVQ